jgi:hypothetical protein
LVPLQQCLLAHCGEIAFADECPWKNARGICACGISIRPLYLTFSFLFGASPNRKDSAPNGRNRKRHASERIEPQKTTPQKDQTAKDTPLKGGSNRKDSAPNGTNRKRRRLKRIKPQKTLPPQKEPFRR